MLKYGIVGMNPGNGHPYSFAAVFNDFDNAALQKNCEFALIKEYLPNHHRHQDFIADGRVTSIWAPEPGAAERIAAAAKIPHIANSLAEMAESVDAILFTRDDIENHWEMTSDLFKTGKPIFIDKILAHNESDLRKFAAAIPADYPLMVGSSFAYTPLIDTVRESIKNSEVMFISGVSSCTWVRYAPHLLTAAAKLFGWDIVSVQNSGRENAETVTLQYRSGITAVFNIYNGVGLPMGLTIHRRGETPVELPCTDATLENYFLSIVNSMQDFHTMCKTRVAATPWQEVLQLNRLVLAGIASREQGNVKIYMDDFLSDIQG